mgnify:FL=1
MDGDSLKAESFGTIHAEISMIQCIEKQWGGAHTLSI